MGTPNWSRLRRKNFYIWHDKILKWTSLEKKISKIKICEKIPSNTEHQVSLNRNIWKFCCISSFRSRLVNFRAEWGCSCYCPPIAEWFHITCTPSRSAFVQGHCGGQRGFQAALTFNILIIGSVTTCALVCWSEFVYRKKKSQSNNFFTLFTTEYNYLLVKIQMSEENI